LRNSAGINCAKVRQRREFCGLFLEEGNMGGMSTKYEGGGVIEKPSPSGKGFELLAEIYN